MKETWEIKKSDENNVDSLSHGEGRKVEPEAWHCIPRGRCILKLCKLINNQMGVTST